MMKNLEQMSRVLYSHVWDDVSQWASALDHLANLNDNEITALAGGGCGPNPAETRDANS
jgi:hypothetical protein